MKRIITATAAATLCLAAPAAAATMHRPAAGVPSHAARIAMSANAGTQVAPSTNWAGYTVTGGRGRFSQVYATFHVPGAVCALTDTSQANAAGFWVGLDGVNSATVEQEGITESCDAIGAAHYAAFTEAYPYENARRAPVAIWPGRVVTTSTTYAAGVFRLQVGSSVRRVRVPGVTRSSAEIITEQPGSANGQIALTAFHKATYTGVGAAWTGPSQTTAIYMVDGAGNIVVVPSALRARGSAFDTTQMF
jgi:Peptidase A4 family